MECSLPFSFSPDLIRDVLLHKLCHTRLSVIAEYSGILLKICYAESGLYLRMNDDSDYYATACLET